MMTLQPRCVKFEDRWSLLLETVRNVITCAPIAKATWNDRFSDVYALCIACPEPLADRLYQETKSFIEEHVKKMQQGVLSEGESNLLASYHKHWQQYSKGAAYLNQLYGYLNTQFINKQKYNEADLTYGIIIPDMSEQMFEIGELALDIWKKWMIEPLKMSMLNLLLGEIRNDRLCISVQQNILHGVITSYVDVEEYKKKSPLMLYEDLFETKFLQETGDHYRQEAAMLKDEHTCSQYMDKVILKMDNENFRSRKFLHPSSYTKVTHECQQKMVGDHMQFLHGECKDMVQVEKRDDLANMYTLLKPIQGGLSVLVQEFEDHIKTIGLTNIKMLKGENMVSLFVESMLDVHSKFTEVIHSVFKGDQNFTGALDKACAAAINFKMNTKHVCKSPELLARYCDNLLKKTSKGLSEVEQDEKLAASITVFKYLDDKDVYQKFYARMLAKRLIYGMSVSMDAEEAMINRLKQACGYEFTNKLHRMFTDMNISDDLNRKYSDSMKEKSIDLGVNFSIVVLQAGAWPIGPSLAATFAIPQELEKSVRLFEIFYNHSFSGRKLTWLHSFCMAELKFNFLKRPYFVSMGTYHMAILLLFNNSETVSFQDFLTITLMSGKELLRQLQVLIEAKIILTEGEMNEKSMFTLNMAYSNKRTKFKISGAVQKDTPQEMEQQQSAVDDDRKMYIHAAIVRIMKARKVLKHNALIQEVISQSKSRFAPAISMIKKCVEALIDKQYLERTQNSADEYSYMA